MSAGDSADELASKLAAYASQRAQILSILEADPENEQFAKLRDDLSMLIGMTEKLYTAAVEEKAEQSDLNKTEKEKEEEPLTTARAPTQAAAASSSSAAPPPAPSLSSPPAAPFPVEPSREASGIGSTGVGDIVLVSGGERPYAGYITSIVTNPALPGGRGVRVKYYEFPNEVELPWSSVARMPHGDITVSSRNTLCNDWQGQCKYGPDQRYYSVKVVALTAFGALVSYPDFTGGVAAVQEEVPLAYLRPNKPKASVLAAAAAKAAADSHAGTGIGSAEIPDKYQLKDSDTPADRAYKLRKIKNIKHKNKEMTKDSEVMAVQQSWKKFVSHGGKRNLQGIVKTSMFSSSSTSTFSEITLDNTDSKDKERMTDYDKRKKHKF